MNKMLGCWLLTSLVLAGCANSPAVRSARFGDKQVYMASLADEPYFAIITDGAIHNAALTNTALFGVEYEGQIAHPVRADSVDFHARRARLRIGGRRYSLPRGRLFLVSAESNPFTVGQFDVSEEDKLRSLMMVDERMNAFFK